MTDSQARSDSALGVFSLTQIRHLMRVEFSRAQRYDYPVSCLVAACDRLEDLRDLYGYEFRAAVMDEVVALVRRSTRSCDYLGRLLDDRLLAILPHTTGQGAEASARRILEDARELDFRPGGNRLQMTLSIGIACYEHENTLFFDSLVESAEAALAEAQAAGGGRYVIRDPARPVPKG